MLIIPTTSALYKREYFSLMMKEEASMCVVGRYLGNPKLMSKQSVKDVLFYFILIFRPFEFLPSKC